MDGRLVLLALVIALAIGIGVDFGPKRSAAELAAERTADAVLVEVDCAQQRRWRFRGEYADSVPALQLWGAAEYTREARETRLDVEVDASADRRGYAVRIAAADELARLERRDGELTRLETGDRARPPVDRC